MAKLRLPKTQNSFPFIFWELCCYRISHLPVPQAKSPKAEASRKDENSTELSTVPAQVEALNEGIFHSYHFFIYEIRSSTNCVKWTLSLLPCVNFSPTFLVLLNLLTLLESELLSPGKWLFSQLTAAAHRVSSALQWLSTLERKIVVEGMLRQAHCCYRKEGNQMLPSEKVETPNLNIRQKHQLMEIL